MSIASAAKLLDALLEYRILRPDQLDKVNSSLPQRSLDPRALAKELIDHGWVTAYQINQLFRGHGAELVLGEYLLLDKLGQGGMGQVFKARHQLMNRIVALKVIRQERLTNPGLVRRFRREIQLVAKLAHPNIVTAHDAQLVGDNCFLVMEYVEGTDLQRLVQRSGPLPVGQACAYIRQAALGLQHAAERGLVHRDVKPSNLQVAADGKIVKVLDMGLARLLMADEPEESGAGLTQAHAILGTPDYMAPEQIDNPRQVDARADIYSLGCAFYFLLTGRPPFSDVRWEEKLVCHRSHQPQPIEQVRPDVSPTLAAVLRKTMAKRREERHAVPVAVADALAPYCQLTTPVPAFVSRLVDNRPSQNAAGTEADKTSSSASTVDPVPVRAAPEPLASVEAATLANAQQSAPPAPRGPRHGKTLRLVMAGGGTLLALLIFVPLFWPKGSDPRPHDTNNTPVGAKVGEVAGSRLLIDEDFREPFEKGRLLPVGWSSKGLSIVKDKDRHGLRVSRPDGTHFVTLPPVTLRGNFSIEGVYLLGLGWANYRSMLTVSLENRGKSALLSVVFNSDGSTVIDKEISLAPSTFIARRPTHFALKREGKKLRLFLDKDPVAGKDFEEIAEYDTLRLGLSGGADGGGIMARLYGVKVATLPP